MAALRLARGYTGKDNYVTFEGSYHGLFDAAMWTRRSREHEGPEQGSGARLLRPGHPEAGAPAVLAGALQRRQPAGRRAEAAPDSIAAVLIEPILGNCCGIPSKPEFITAVRELCTKYNVLMIVDEVKTGFRVGKGGAQALYGIEADIFTVAKAMAQRLPDRGDRRPGGDHAPIRQGRRPWRHLHRPGDVAWRRPRRRSPSCGTPTALDGHRQLRQVRCRRACTRILSRRGIPHSFTGHESMCGLFFSAKAPTTYRNWKISDYTFYDTLAGILIDMGVMCEPDSREPWFISAAHDESVPEGDAEQVRAGGRPDPRRGQAWRRPREDVERHPGRHGREAGVLGVGRRSGISGTLSQRFVGRPAREGRPFRF